MAHTSSIVFNTDTIKQNALENRLIKPVYEKGYRPYGMYIGVKNDPSIKQNKNILLTMRDTEDLKNDRHQYLSTETYKRRTAIKEDGKVVGYHEVGERKWKWALNKVAQYSNILHAWRDVFDFPQVSYGLTCFRREVVVIDSDVYFPSFQAAEKTVDNFCKNVKVPMVNYLLRNPTSGHIQCGWVLDKPFEKEQFPYFNSLIKRVAIAWQEVSGFEGDICFNGPSCKNPFYEGFESSLYSYSKVDNVEFMENIAELRASNAVIRINNYSSSSSFSYTHNERKPTTKTISNYSVKQLKPTSRRDYILPLLDSWILSTANKEGKLPELTEVEEQANIYSKEASDTLGKELLPNKEIKELSNTCLNYCKKQWHKGTSKTSFSDKARQGSAYMKRLSQFCKAVEVRADNEKLTVREMAEKHSCSIGAVSKYKKMSEEEMASLAEEVARFVEYCSSFSSDSIEYIEKRKVCEKALATYYSLMRIKYYSSLFLSLIHIMNVLQETNKTETTNNIHTNLIMRIKNNDETN